MKRNPLILLVGIAILICGAATAITYFKKPTNTPPSSISNIVPRASSTALYINPAVGISMEYPAGWQSTNEYSSFGNIPGGYYGQDSFGQYGFFIVEQGVPFNGVIDSFMSLAVGVQLAASYRKSEGVPAVAEQIYADGQKAWAVVPSPFTASIPPDSNGIIKYPEVFLYISPSKNDSNPVTWVRMDWEHAQAFLNSIHFSSTASAPTSSVPWRSYLDVVRGFAFDYPAMIPAGEDFVYPTPVILADAPGGGKRQLHLEFVRPGKTADLEKDGCLKWVPAPLSKRPFLVNSIPVCLTVREENENGTTYRMYDYGAPTRDHNAVDIQLTINFPTSARASFDEERDTALFREIIQTLREF